MVISGEKESFSAHPKEFPLDKYLFTRDSHVEFTNVNCKNIS
jgi:hypothetical protein